MMRISSSACSDIGRTRTENQDRWFADDQLGLFIVADGIGGGPHGGVAADVVVKVLPSLIRRWLTPDGSRIDDVIAASANLAAIEDQLKSDLSQVSDQLREESDDVPGLDGMGSTAVVAVFIDMHVVVGHLGDSRVYRLRDGELSQLTVDHSVAQVLITTGELSADDAARHPSCTRLTRFVGMPPPALPAVSTHPVRPGDRFLLCTDGVSGAMSPSALTSLLRGRNSDTVTSESLVRSAVESCGRDNATAVIVDAFDGMAGAASGSDSSAVSQKGDADA